MSGYDIIGDIHAQADRLRELLKELGYTGLNFTHPEGRRIIFVGDYINRGPQNRETIQIVQKIVDNGGRAVMGNHEFKAICYSKPGIHGNIRPHTVNNTAEHAGFLEEYPYSTNAYVRVVRWFETLPVYIRTPHFNVVHACWNEDAISASEGYVREKDGVLRSKAYRAYDTENPTPFTQALDVLLKGPRFKLPRGVNYIDGQGHPAKETRLLWWHDKTRPAAELIDKGHLVEEFLSETNKRQIINLRNKFNYASKQIVFIGHYNLSYDRYIDSPKVVCLNYKEHLMAYRWNEGDRGVVPGRLVCI